MWLIGAWWGLGSVAWARGPECVGAAVEPAFLTAALDEAAAGWAALQPAVFHAAIDRAVLALPCLDAVLAPGEAARLHFYVGLRLVADRQSARGAEALRAARALDPGAALAGVLPPGHAVAAEYRAYPAEAPFEAVPLPAEGRLWFDGAARQSRPAGRATVVQREDAGGGVVDTRYLFAGGALPPYAVAGEAGRGVAGGGGAASGGGGSAPLPAAPVAPRRGRAAGWALGGVAVAAALGSAAAYTVALRSEAAFGATDVALTRAELLALRGRTNAAGAWGLGLLGVAGAAGVGAVVVGAR